MFIQHSLRDGGWSTPWSATVLHNPHRTIHTCSSELEAGFPGVMSPLRTPTSVGNAAAQVGFLGRVHPSKEKRNTSQ